MTDINKNVDPAEIDKFSQLAHRWWDPNSEFKPLHEINPIRLNFIQQFVELNGKNILDVGCGGGILSESMAQLGANVTGIDLSKKALKVAKLHLLESNVSVNYREIAIEDLVQEVEINQQPLYDVVTCMEMLEHVPNPLSIIQSCAKLVKKGGHVFFSTLNRNPKSYVFAVLGAEYILNLLPKGTHEYSKFIKPSELSSYCRQSELLVDEFAGLTYNPFSKVYSATDDISVNYCVHTIKS